MQHNMFCLSSQQGDTPLIMVTKREMVEIVKLLLDRGADMNSKDQVIYLNERIHLKFFACIISLLESIMKIIKYSKI